MQAFPLEVYKAFRQLRIWSFCYGQWKSDLCGQQDINQLILQRCLVLFEIPWHILDYSYYFRWTQISHRYCIISARLGYTSHTPQRYSDVFFCCEAFTILTSESLLKFLRKPKQTKPKTHQKPNYLKVMWGYFYVHCSYKPSRTQSVLHGTRS